MNIIKRVTKLPLIEQLLSSLYNFLLIIVAVSILTQSAAIEFGQSLLYITIGNLFLIALTFYPHTTLRLKENIYGIEKADKYIFSIATYILIISVVILILNLVASLLFIFYLYIAIRLYLEFLRKYYLIKNAIAPVVIFNFCNIVFLVVIYILNKQNIYDFTLSEFLLSQTFIYVVFVVFSIINFGLTKPKSSYCFDLIREAKWYCITALGQNLSSNLSLLYLANIAEGYYFLIYKSIQNIFNIFNPLLNYFDSYGYTRVAQLKLQNKKYIWYLGKSVIAFSLFFICCFIVFNVFSKEIITFFYNADVASYSYLTVWFSMLTIISLFLTFFSIVVRVNEKSYLGSIAYIFTSLFAYLFAENWVEELNLLGAIYITIFCSLITLFIYGIGCFNEYKNSACSAWKS